MKRILIFIVLFICLGLVAWSAWAGLGPWLAKSDTIQSADVIICLNGAERIKKTAELYRKGWAREVILTVAEEKKPLTRLGIPESMITLVPGPRTTYQEVMAVTPLLLSSGYSSGIVVTDPFHLRRVRWTFENVLKDQPITLTYVASDIPLKIEGWWKEKESSRYVYSEVSKLGWYWIVYGLLGSINEPPWAVKLKHIYEGWLDKVVG